MPNFTISEILTIMLVILIVFGPQRLPEMAQKTGQLVRRARTIVNDLRREFAGEWEEVAQPLKEVRDEMIGAQEDVKSSMTSLSEDVAQAKAELEAEVARAKEELDQDVAETGQDREDTIAERPDEGEDGT